MKSLMKVLVLVSLMIISRLDKQNWQLTNEPVKASNTPVLPDAAIFTKANSGTVPQFLLTQKLTYPAPVYGIGL